jgi:hypothetical protein
MTKKIATDLTTRPAAHTTHTAIVSPDQTLINKRFATVRAQLALAGYEVRECWQGGWFVTGHYLTQFCRDLDDLEAMVEGKP